jgi:exo-1,4-beta-D-glucosaminidase
MKYFFPIGCFIFSCLALKAQNSEEDNILLREGWLMQSAIPLNAGGAEISRENYKAGGWYPVSLPTTVIAGLLKNKVYDFDPFYGSNLQRIAGPQFDSAWWFRKEFSLPASSRGKILVLILHGLNYRANVWLNGTRVADSSQLVGPFRLFTLNITRYVQHAGVNVLSIEIRRPFNPNKREGDLAIDYADWIHYPADYNGGILNDVVIRMADPVSVDYPLVVTHFDLPSLELAHLQVTAELTNYSDHPQTVELKGKINEDIRFQQKCQLGPGEQREVTFRSADFPQLNVHNPRIWWPWQYGEPLLNQLELTVEKEGRISSRLHETFGIRQINSELINNRSRVFLVNGKRILLRGAAWSPDIFQRRSPQRQEQEMRLVRDMNMNIVRSEGKLEDEHFYDLCDRYGLLLMTGWMCCGAWQYPELWDSGKRKVALESDRSVMYWLRDKACLLAWLNGSDMPPRDSSLERQYLSIENQLQFPDPILSTADASVSKVSGYSGVKMNGPYDWVPPIYWEGDSNRFGGAWSFATEISPGPSIPPMESLLRFIPKDSLSPTNSDWLYHCGTMTFGNTNIFLAALSARYGQPSSISDLVTKAQMQDYEGHRAMMEGYGWKKYHFATGVVQWMLSNPWPGLIWHTYDYYLYPGGTYFGIKKALEPMHVQYSYESGMVGINNSFLKNFPGCHVSASLYDANGKIIFAKESSTVASPDSVTACFAIPSMTSPGDVSFLRLELRDGNARLHSINWYWLSGKQDSLAWNKSKWYYTPESSYADFSGLQKLPACQLKESHAGSESGAETIQTIQLRNTGQSIAFFVHIRVLKAEGADDILPVRMDDNYFSLAPGEEREIQCRYLTQDAGASLPFIQVSAWHLDVAGSQAGPHAGWETMPGN